jgi:hypothetical protein
VAGCEAWAAARSVHEPPGDGSAGRGGDPEDTYQEADGGLSPKERLDRERAEGGEDAGRRPEQRLGGGEHAGGSPDEAVPV